MQAREAQRPTGAVHPRDVEPAFGQQSDSQFGKRLQCAMENGPVSSLIYLLKVVIFHFP